MSRSDAEATDPTAHRARSLWLPLLVTGYLVWAAAYIAGTSFVVDGRRYFVLIDDAMVSMTYARNLAEGHGLVWNAGEAPVSGYTNPLWTLFMAALHLFGGDPSTMCLAVQCSAALLLAANLVVVRRIADLVTGGDVAVAAGAVILTATYLPLNRWALEGMEVGALALLVSLGTWRALLAARGEGRSWTPYAILAVAVLVRLDMAVPFVVIWAYLLWQRPADRRAHILSGAAALLASTGAVLLFHQAYYGDPLPNTYYLKMSGFPLLLRVARGFIVFAEFAWDSNLLLLLLPAAAIFLRQAAACALPLLLGAALSAYSVWVGGDFLESWFPGTNRFIAPAVPAYFVVLCLVVRTLAGKVTDGIDASSPRALRGAAMLTYPAVLVLAFLELNGGGQARQLLEAAAVRPSRSVAQRRPDVEAALRVCELTTPDASIAVVAAGTSPYFSRRRAVDLLGKSDPVIAHGPSRIPAGRGRFRAFTPGHTKWDYAYSIGRVAPDLVIDLCGAPEEATPHLAAAYREIQVGGATWYARKDSPNVLWDEVARIAEDEGR